MTIAVLSFFSIINLVVLGGLIHSWFTVAKPAGFAFPIFLTAALLMLAASNILTAMSLLTQPIVMWMMLFAFFCMAVEVWCTTIQSNIMKSIFKDIENLLKKED